MSEPPVSRSRYSDLDLHELVVQRIYHEDSLFAQRSYTLLTVHAFLATAFSVLLVSDSEKKSWLLAACLVSGLGAVLGIFQSAVGRQTNRAIGFWREYLKLIETKCRIPFDTLQYNFYEKAAASTPFGTINRRSESERALYSTRPRAFTSHTILIGFVLPLLLTLLWTTGFQTAAYPQILVQGSRTTTVNAKLKPGAVSSTVKMFITDEWPAYPAALKSAGIHELQHHTIRHKDKIYVQGPIYTNTVESAFSLFKRGLMGASTRFR